VLVLALDTATPAVTAGVVHLDARAGRPALEVLAERVEVDGRRHGELLAPLVQDCLDAAGLTPADLSAVVTGAGPGPFTGLRVGMVTAAAFGDALEVPVHGVCSLDAVAAAVSFDGEDGDLLVATDARRREVYWAGYRGPVRVAGPFVDRPAAVPARLVEVGQEVADAGTPGWRPQRAYGGGAELYAEVLGLPVPVPGAGPTAAGLVSCAAVRLAAGAPGEPLRPLYLRRPDAVEPAPRRTVLQ